MEVRRIAERLATVHEPRSDLLRDIVVESLRQAIGCDGVIYYNVCRSDEGLAFRSIHSDVPDLLPTEGHAVLRSPTLRIAAPPAGERNHFSPACERWSRPGARKDPLVEAVYHPLRVYDDLRLLAYDGDRFVGWVGAVRRGSGKNFDRVDAHALSILVPSMRRLLALAARLDGNEDAHGNMLLVVAPGGRVLHASPDAAAWLNPSRLGVLARVVASFDARGQPGQAAIDGTCAQLVRLDGEGGTVYCVTLSALQPVRLQSLAALTAAQREVARLAASGATVDQIAGATTRSPGTVRVHLKAIYRRLGFSSRAELARTVEQWNRNEHTWTQAAP